MQGSVIVSWFEYDDLVFCGVIHVCSIALFFTYHLSFLGIITLNYRLGDSAFSNFIMSLLKARIYISTRIELQFKSMMLV
jgi:hypothetical protein